MAITKVRRQRIAFGTAASRKRMRGLCHTLSVYAKWLPYPQTSNSKRLFGRQLHCRLRPAVQLQDEQGNTENPNGDDASEEGDGVHLWALLLLL
jgi:hypothetical protein